MDSNQMQVSDRVLEAVDAGRKVEAIKLLREETGMGLREARDVVDSLDNKRHPERARLPVEGGAGGMVKLIVTILVLIAAYFFFFEA